MVARKPIGVSLLSLASFLAIWQLAALWADSRLFPAPLIVLEVLLESIAEGELQYHIGHTLLRVAVSFALAMAAGIGIGIALGRSKPLDRFFDGWLTLFLNIPALVTIILCYVWLGLIETAAVLAVAINKIPNVVVTIREGARALERDYLEMAQSFRLSRFTVLCHIVLPQLAPFLVASTRSGLALIWKIVLVVELLGRSNGVGFQLHLFFQLFDIASILAYTLAFVLVIQVLEYGLLQPLERRASRWRR
ncbi:MAG: ABC transporter permease [SAR324 cluster bacterium]|nr:ABC transporter permease [SAR324 cluster bacterium]